MSINWIGSFCRLALLGATLYFCLTREGLAETMRDSLVAELRDEGFSDIKITRTLLGRIRIVATGPNGAREIVFNPSNNAILRDYKRQETDPLGVENSGLGARSDSDDDRPSQASKRREAERPRPKRQENAPPPAKKPKRLPAP